MGDLLTERVVDRKRAELDFGDRCSADRRRDRVPARQHGHRRAFARRAAAARQLAVVRGWTTISPLPVAVLCSAIRSCRSKTRITPAWIRVFAQKENLIAEHKTATGKGEMVVEAAHYGELPRRCRTAAAKPAVAISELAPGPGVGLHYPVPDVEFRPLSIYNAFCEEAAYVASV